jgi:hypothetical protein
VAKPQAPQRERHALGDVGLEALGGAERHRRGDVERQPRRQRALRHLQPDVRLAGARRRGRVDAPDVVADDVGPQLGELGAGADAGRPPVARQRAGDAVRDREAEGLQQRRGHRPGTLPRGGRREDGAIGHAAVLARRA